MKLMILLGEARGHCVYLSHIEPLHPSRVKLIPFVLMTWSSLGRYIRSILIINVTYEYIFYCILHIR